MFGNQPKFGHQPKPEGGAASGSAADHSKTANGGRHDGRSSGLRGGRRAPRTLDFDAGLNLCGKGGGGGKRAVAGGVKEGVEEEGYEEDLMPLSERDEDEDEDDEEEEVISMGCFDPRMPNTASRIPTRGRDSEDGVQVHVAPTDCNGLQRIATDCDDTHVLTTAPPFRAGTCGAFDPGLSDLQGCPHTPIDEDDPAPGGRDERRRRLRVSEPELRQAPTARAADGARDRISADRD